MKTTFIATVLNEETTIDRLLESIKKQTVKPDEIIITDGGSTDGTIKKIIEFKKKHNIQILVIQIKGNRAMGRNAAIEKAKGEIILCSDAGCILDKDWVKKIGKPFAHSVDVVAGYYKGQANTIFQKCLIPYVLVMPDKVKSNTFLPATRSMAFTKEIWHIVGKFPAQFSHNEDYVFAKEIRKHKANVAFVKSAIVYWSPPHNIRKVFTMLYRFAKGDMQAGIIRPKVVLLFIRYCIVLLLIYFMFLSTDIFIVLVGLFVIYVVWSVEKNYKYVQNLQAVYILPLLQFTADAAVISGTIVGFFANT